MGEKEYRCRFCVVNSVFELYSIITTHTTMPFPLSLSLSLSLCFYIRLWFSFSFRSGDGVLSRASLESGDGCCPDGETAMASCGVGNDVSRFVAAVVVIIIRGSA